MMAKIETSVDPDAVLRDRNVLLGVDRPLTGSGDGFLRTGAHSWD